ncbi:MAG: phage GP46 family protein [Comamonas sp.]
MPVSIATAPDVRSALQRAVVISLLTWRRAEPSDSVDDAELQGWWGDSYPAEPNDRIGSRLWLLRRRSITPQTLRDAQRYCEEALQWMVDDGLVNAVQVTITRAGVQQLTARVVLSRPGGDPVVLTIEDLLQVSHAL